VNGYFHIAFLVPDIDAAMDEFGGLFEVDWRPVHEVVLELGTSVADRKPRRTRVTFTTGGPPAIELFEWETPPSEPALERPVLHHIGRWVDNLAAESSRLEAHGCHLALTLPGTDGKPERFAMHETSFGLQIELVDVTIPKPHMVDLWPPD
jgi:catechol 2,3-dioxygenase-like lactoylglutathione lyase family enzyme